MKDLLESLAVAVVMVTCVVALVIIATLPET